MEKRTARIVVTLLFTVDINCITVRIGKPSQYLPNFSFHIVQLVIDNDALQRELLWAVTFSIDLFIM